MKSHPLCKVIYALPVRPVFEKRADTQQKHNIAGGVEVAVQHRNGDGRRIKHRHFQLSFSKAPEAPNQKRHGADSRHNHADRFRQNQGRHAASCYKKKQTVLEFPLQLTPCVFRNRYGAGFIPEFRQCLHRLIPSSGQIKEDHIHRAFMHDRAVNAGNPLQKILQEIRLSGRHAGLHDVHPHSSVRFM